MIAKSDFSEDGSNNKKTICRHTISHPDEETRLKLRVEQQLDVICSLKCEVNGREKENKTMRTEMEDIEASSSQLQLRLAQELRAKEMLSDRFDTLASNHKEMIGLMKEYKKECVQLKQSLSSKEGESSEIREEMLKYLTDELHKKECEIQQLQGRISSLEETNASLSEETIELKKSVQTITSRESQLVSEMYMVRQDSAARVSLFEEKFEGVNTLLDQNRRDNADLRDKIELMEVEKSGIELNSLKLAEELTSSKIEVERMKVEVRESNERREASERRFKTEADKVSKDIQTAELRRELEETKQEFSSLESRHQSYKQYTSELLEQEKEINRKLRDVLS